jgi:hypothetical protein
VAIYHLSVRVGSRAGGQSATAKAMYNQRQGDYAHRRLELVHSASGNMPAWAGKPLQYWQAADANERANGNLFREVEAALPLYELFVNECRRRESKLLTRTR